LGGGRPESGGLSGGKKEQKISGRPSPRRTAPGPLFF